MITVKICNTDDFPDDIVASIKTRLPEWMVNEVLKYKFLQDQKSRAIARLILLDSIIETGYTADLLYSFERDANNKPFIKNWVGFNISHSGKMVLFAYGENHLGVDVEKIQPVEIDLFKNYLHNAEADYVRTTPDPLLSFYNIWSRKEAVLKADGIGIVYDIQRLNVIPPIIPLNGNTYTLSELELPPNYVGFLACPADLNPDGAVTQKKISRLNCI